MGLIDETIVLPEICRPWVMRQRTGMAAADEYPGHVLRDYRQIEPFLPRKVNTILDIGCGMAGIDVLLKRRYPQARLLLLDGEGEAALSGFEFTTGACNSRAATEALLAANGIRPDGWYNIGTGKKLRADLVVSLASWGFHYALGMYNVRGYCIADLRKMSVTPRGKIIASYRKYWRCAWTQT